MYVNLNANFNTIFHRIKIIIGTAYLIFIMSIFIMSTIILLYF